MQFREKLRDRTLIWGGDGEGGWEDWGMVWELFLKQFNRVWELNGLGASWEAPPQMRVWELCVKQSNTVLELNGLGPPGRHSPKGGVGNYF